MRKHLIWAGPTLALALGSVTACGSTSTASASPAVSCVNAAAPHRVYLVVEHLSGATTQKCVGFSTDTIDGQSLMDSSTIEYQAQTFSFGKAVCQVDHEPATFTECFPQNKPYWALFVETNGTWASAPNGYTQEMLHDKDALGWRYVSAADQSPSPPPAAREG